MNEFIRDWIAEINEQTSRVESLVKNIALEKFNEKPAPNKWSIGELIDHLLVTNGLYFSLLAPVVSGDYKPIQLLRLKFFQRKMGKLILSLTTPETKRKVKTMRVFEPKRSHVELSVFAEFAQQQSELIEIVRKLEGTDLDKTYIKSPVGSMVIYNLHDALTIILNHEKRHIGQAEKLKRTESPINDLLKSENP